MGKEEYLFWLIHKESNKDCFYIIIYNWDY